VRSADVSFEDDVGLIRLDGRVTPVDSRVEGVFTDISVYSSVDVVDLDPESGVLRGRVKPLAFAVRRVSLYVTNPVGRRLLEQLARENVSTFEALAFPIEIPVHLEQQIDLPGAGPDGPVQFPGAVIPIALTVSQVTSLHGRLWISVAPSWPGADTTAASAG
jgi:hypothetical protein